MKKQIVLSISVGVLTLTAGCSTVSDGFVLREWKRNMQELGVYPKFPLEEDVKIGDVYRIPENDLPGGSLDNSSPLTFGYVTASLVSPTEVKKFYDNRYSYEGTSTFALGPGNVLPVGTTTTTLVAKAFPQEMRRVAFPHFFRVKATGAQVGALIPIGHIAGKLGIDARSVESADISVHDAGSTMLPMGQIASRLIDATGKLNHTALSFTSEGAAKAFLAPRRQDPNKGMVELFVINQVYYARSFDINLALSSNVKAGLTNAGAGAAVPQAAASEAKGAADTGAVKGAVDYVDGALQSGITSLLPASGFSVVASQSQAGTIGLTQVYDRYLAIGYRGVKVVVRPSDMKIIDISAPSTPGPLAIKNEQASEDAERTTNPPKK